MSTLGSNSMPSGSTLLEPKTVEALRKQMMRGELYALAVLIGLELSAVYVIGSVVLSCTGP